MSATTWPPGFSDPDREVLPLTVRQPVAWGDMDAMGHVNNAVYLRWMENVRFELFRRLGVIQLHQQEHKGPILARATVDFLLPVTFPDALLVSASVARLGTKSFTLASRVWSTAQSGECARGEAVIVMVDYDRGASIPLPAAIRTGLEHHMGA